MTDEQYSRMAPLGDILAEVWERLGLAPIPVMKELVESWDDLAGPPWAGTSAPLSIRYQVLYVEAAEPSMVKLLTYQTAQLQTRLENHFGPGMVSSVKVAGPSDRRGKQKDDKTPGKGRFISNARRYH